MSHSNATKEYSSLFANVFPTLPHELVERICLLLDAESMLNCRLVNRKLNQIIQSSTVLQYLLACTAAGVINNPRSTLPQVERLATLNKREDAWRELKPIFETTIKVEHKPSVVYGITTGTYVLTDINRRDLHYCHLPSSPKENPRWRSIQGHGPGQNRDGTLIGMCLAVHEHDLLVTVISSEVVNQENMQLASIDLVLLKFSTGEYHPLARRPRIHVQTTMDEIWIFARSVGDNLALIIGGGSPGDKLFIFDWKTGHRRLQHEAAEHAYRSLGFVSPELLLVPNIHYSSQHFEVWHLPLSQPTNPKPPVQILCLKMPATSSGCILTTIYCNGEPNPYLDFIPHPPPRPFYTSPEDSIIIANFRLQYFENIISYTLVMHRRALLDTIQKWTSSFGSELTWVINEVTVRNVADPDNEGSCSLDAWSKVASIDTNISPSLPPRSSYSHGSSSVSSGLSESNSEYTSSYCLPRVQWKDWGPPISRWFEINDLNARWSMQSSGQRYVFLARSPRDWRKWIVNVADFNQYSVRRKTGRGRLGEGGDDDGDNAKKEKLELLDHEGVFEEEVYMGLKCVVHHMPDNYDFDVMLMEEERLLGLKVDNLFRTKSFKVLHFG